MFSKSNLLATLVAGIFNFIRGYIVWVVTSVFFVGIFDIDNLW
jgi:hypothetical protein